MLLLNYNRFKQFFSFIDILSVPALYKPCIYLLFINVYLQPQGHVLTMSSPVEMASVSQTDGIVMETTIVEMEPMRSKFLAVSFCAMYTY